MGPYVLVTAVSSTTITVNDPEDAWSDATLPSAILKLPTQSTIEICQSIQMAELKMRTIELPALRTNPYDDLDPTVLITDAKGMSPIPADMCFPILFFQESQPTDQPPGGTNLGPWIVYDRVGDREIIRRRMIDQLYIRPFGVPRVIRASFSEVGPNYVFTPNPARTSSSRRTTNGHSPFCLAQQQARFIPLFKAMRSLHRSQRVTSTGLCGHTMTRTKTLKKHKSGFQGLMILMA